MAGGSGEDGPTHKQLRMNPKALRAEEMFGETDKVSGEEISLQAAADPMYQGKVAIPDIVTGAYAMAAAATGVRDWTNMSEEQFQAATDYLRKLHKNVRFYWTDPGQLDALLSEAINEVTGLTPSLSTDGGTSDARFIKEYCPVVEFGLTTASIHKADEHVAVTDLETLTAVYRRFIALYFETFGGADAG